MSEKKKRNEVSPIGRVSFPAVFKPQGMAGDEPKYGLTLIFSKGTDLKQMGKVATAAVYKKWGDNPPKNLRSPFRDCSEKDHLDGYKDGGTFVAFRSGVRPVVLDSNRNEVLPQDPDGFYAGCWACVSYNAYTYAPPNGRPGVAFGLIMVLKTKDDERFGVGGSVDDFEDVDTDGGEEPAMFSGAESLFD